jgi:hypothetical protein
VNHPSGHRPNQRGRGFRPFGRFLHRLFGLGILFRYGRGGNDRLARLNDRLIREDNFSRPRDDGGSSAGVGSKLVRDQKIAGYSDCNDAKEQGYVEARPAINSENRSFPCRLDCFKTNTSADIVDRGGAAYTYIWKKLGKNGLLSVSSPA